MNEFEDLTSRLKALGDNPVPPPVATQHLTAMAEVAAPRTRFSHKLRVAAAFGVGILVGGTGLGYAAAQEALPGPAQNAVEAAGRVVGLEVAKEKSKNKAGGEGAGSENAGGSVERVDCGDGAKNHGEHVRNAAKAARNLPEDQREAFVKAAAESDCGKPVNANEGDGAEELEDPADDAGPAEGKGNKPEGVGGGKPETTGPDAAGNADDNAGEEEELEEEELEEEELEDEGEQGPPEGTPAPGGPPEGTPAP